MRPGRRGITLAVVSLLIAILLVAGLAIVWATTSDAMQTARAVDRERLEALIASAQDEARDAVDQLFAREAGASPWRERLLAQLEQRLRAAGDRTDPGAYAGVEVVVPALELPGTTAACAQIGARVVECGARFHAFRPLVYPLDGHFRGEARRAGYYREGAFGDDATDPVPRDFQGFVAVRVTIAIPSAFGALRRTIDVLRDVKVLDVTPPAAEFAAFNYGPPPDSAYVLADLNSGGTLAFFPKGRARMFVRGPLLLAVEDAVAPTHQGGALRGGASISYPEPGNREWHGWAFVPGPRAIRWPNFAASPGQILSIVTGLLGGAGAAAFTKPPVRPAKDSALMGLIGLIPEFAGGTLAGQVGVYYPIPGSEELGTAFPWVYLSGTARPGQQSFSIAGLTPERFGAAAAPAQQLYRGLVVRRGDRGSYELVGTYDRNLELPRSGYAAGRPVNDEDLIVPEPFHYDAGASDDAEDAPRDHGVYGVYKLVHFDRDVYWPIDLKPLLRLLSGIPFIGAPFGAIVAFLDATGMRLIVSPVRWTVEAPPDLGAPGDIAAAFETTKLIHPYFLAPYGVYHDRGQNQAALAELATDATQAALKAILRKTVPWAVGKLFASPPGAPRIAERLSDKVGAYFRSVATGQKHAVFGWVLRRLAKSRLGGAERTVEGFARVLTRWGIGEGIEKLGNFGINQVVQVVKDAMRGLDLTRRSAQQRALVNLEPERLRAVFPKGLYPPKYRPYGRSAAVEYETFEDFLRGQAAPGGDRVILDGIYRIRKLAFEGRGRTIVYQGRGVVVAEGEEGDRPVLDARVLRADPASYLTLVYENPAVTASRRSALALGEEFHGTVCATQGVKPAGDRTRILGNLVTFHLNKAQIPDGREVRVFYDHERLPAAGGSQRAWWAVQVSPRVAAVTPSRD